MKTLFSAMFVLTFSTTSFAVPGGDRPDVNHTNSKESKPEIVNWVGFIESNGGHTTRHDHDLEFVRKSDGESFDIVDSPELEKIHCEKSKRLLVKIEAERTPQFLFWGDNLIVKKFDVLEELELIPHKKYEPQISRNFSDRR